MKNEIARCPKCGDLLEEGALHCVECGEKIFKPKKDISLRKRWREYSREIEIKLDSVILSLLFLIIAIILISVAMAMPWWVKERKEISEYTSNVESSKSEWYLTKANFDTDDIGLEWATARKYNITDGIGEYDKLESETGFKNRCSIFSTTHTACIIALIINIITVIFILITNIGVLVEVKSIINLSLLASLFICGFIPIFFYLGLDGALEADAKDSASGFERRLEEGLGEDVEMEVKSDSFFSSEVDEDWVGNRIETDTHGSTGWYLSIFSSISVFLSLVLYKREKKKQSFLDSLRPIPNPNSIENEEYECIKCASTISENDEFCPNCKTSLYRCPQCKVDISRTDDVCPNCKVPFLYCIECGASIFDEDEFCPNCRISFVEEVLNEERIVDKDDFISNSLNKALDHTGYKIEEENKELISNIIKNNLQNIGGVD